MQAIVDRRISNRINETDRFVTALSISPIHPSFSCPSWPTLDRAISIDLLISRRSLRLWAVAHKTTNDDKYRRDDWRNLNRRSSSRPITPAGAQSIAETGFGARTQYSGGPPISSLWKCSTSLSGAVAPGPDNALDMITQWRRVSRSGHDTFDGDTYISTRRKFRHDK